ncbi:MAG: hypothetical protein NT164_01725 [Verrucomicrobiae bacterium]|nr:hypothetical protein [Verrucomicrobiae bacterium]
MLSSVLNEVVADAVPGTRSADPQCISNTRGREHRSDAAMRGYNFSENALRDHQFYIDSRWIPASAGMTFGCSVFLEPV